MESQIPSSNRFNNSDNRQCIRNRKVAQQITLSGFLFLFSVLANISCKKTNSDYRPQVYPTVTSIKPLSAKSGDTVMIIGANFNLNPSMDTVMFNSVPAKIEKVKADTLFVVVPTGNATGVVTVNGISAPGPVFTVLQIGVTGVKPAWGKQGDTILIIGTNFYLNPLEDTVKINGVNASVLKASTDTLHVIVPITSTGGITVNGMAAPAPDFIYKPTVFVTTFAGTGTASSPSDFGDGVDSLAKISPLGLCFDKQGNLFVSDGVYCIRQISAGFVSTFAGNHVSGNANGPKLNAEFSGLGNGIAFDAQNNLYVTDGLKVRLISNGMVSDFTNVFGQSGDLNGPLSTATFYYPGGITFDAQGNLYVAEPGDIRKISPGGIVSTFAGKLPTVDSPGVVIQFPLNIRPSLGYVNGQDTAARFGHIGSLTTDAQGNVYAGDLECQCVRKITPSGLVSTLGSVGVYNYRDSYNMLSGLCADAAGNIYVSRQSAIYKITPQGATSVLAGKVTSWPSDTGENFGFGYADGPATIARFNYPQGLAFDAQGNLYLADSGNGRIRKISFQ